MAKKNRKLKVDMTGVESYTRCPEGDWLAKLSSIEEGTVQGSGDDCLKARFEVIKGSAAGCAVFETFSLTDKALWKLKGFLEAIGMKANGKLSLDLDALEGKICVIEVIHDEYNGAKRAKIASYLKPSEIEDEDEDDEDDEIEEDDEEEEPAPKKSKKTTSAKSVKKPVKNTDEDDDDEEDEDEDEDEEPVRAKKTKKNTPAKKGKTAAKGKKKPVEPEEDEDDDDDWEDDD